MPAYNFQPQFVPAIKHDQKRSTIRGHRRDNRKPKVGETMYLYTGMRTKKCRLVKVVKCKCVTAISIEFSGIYIGRKRADAVEALAIARTDGFETVRDLMSFFERTHHLPFCGWWIEW